MPIELGGTSGKGSFTNTAARKILNDLDVATGLFDSVDLRLYTSGPTPNPGMLWSHFAEATFGGYAAVATLTFLAAAWEDDLAVMRSIDPPAVFDATGAPVEDVKGWAVTKTVAGVTTIIYAEDLDTPKHMAGVGDQLVIIPEFRLNPAA